MTNPNYKKYIGYIGAGIFGVLLVIGLRGASAATPADLPSSNVTPTFSGLNVNGGAKIQEILEVADISVSGDIDLAGDLQASKTVEAGGELRAKGGIANPDGDVKINDAFNIDDEFYTGADPAAITPVKGYYTILDRLFAFGAAVFKGDVSFQSDAHVTGDVSIAGSANADKLSVANNLTVGGKLGVSGDSVLNGTLKNNADTLKVYDANGNLKEQLTPAPFYIDDNMKISGDLNAKSMQISGKAALSGDTEIKNAYITGSLQNSAGDGDFVKIDDQLDVRKGIFNNDGTKLIKFGSGSSPMDLSVTGKSTLSGNVDIKGEISNSTPKSGTVSGLTQPVNIKDDLKVTGNITATGKIGKYTIRSGGPYSVSGGGSLTKATACNSGETVISCSYKGKSPTAASEDFTFGLELNNMIISDSSAVTDKNSCKVSVKNTIANKLDLYVYSVCFDPTSN